MFLNESLVGARFRENQFRNARVDFTSANIKNCDFRGAHFNSWSYNSINVPKKH